MQTSPAAGIAAQKDARDWFSTCKNPVEAWPGPTRLISGAQGCYCTRTCGSASFCWVATIPETTGRVLEPRRLPVARACQKRRGCPMNCSWSSRTNAFGPCNVLCALAHDDASTSERSWPFGEPFLVKTTAARLQCSQSEKKAMASATTFARHSCTAALGLTLRLLRHSSKKSQDRISRLISRSLQMRAGEVPRGTGAGDGVTGEPGCACGTMRSALPPAAAACSASI